MRRKPTKPALTAIGRGFQISNKILSNCLGLIIPVIIGYFVDQRLGTTPALVLIGSVIGMVIGGFQLYSLVQFLDQLNKAKKERSGLESKQENETLKPDRDW